MSKTARQSLLKISFWKYENYDAYQHTEYLHFDTTSGGKGKYITDGKAIDITWSRPSFYEPAKYYDASGNEIT